MSHTKTLRPFACTAIVLAAGLWGASPAGAALITFSGLDGGTQGNPINPLYQPLQNTYSGSSNKGNSTPTSLPYTDGANIGVGITWDTTSSLSYRATNNGVTDHTNDGAGVVFYDNGNATMTMIFSSPVTIPDFFYAYFNHGATTADTFSGFTNPGDATPSIVLTQAYPGGQYNWQEVTGFGTTPIEKVTFSAQGGAGQFLQLDDLTVNAVPEPASLSLLGLGALGLMARRGRR